MTSCPTHRPNRRRELARLGAHIPATLGRREDTQVKLLDADGKTEIYAGYGTADVGLPVGTYKVSISGQTEDVKIEAGKVTEF